MELRQLEYFLATVRAGTISEAARTLYLTQPSLSAQIRKLERELGGPLFVRLGRTLSLTPAGIALIPYAEDVLRRVEQSKQEVRRTIALHTGRLILGAIPSFDAAVLPRVLREFGTLHPEIEVSIREADVASAFEGMILQGDLDLAIQLLPCRHKDLESALLVREPIVLFVPPDHPLAERTSVAIEDLEHEPFVTLREGHGLRKHLFSLCRAAGFQPKISFETTQLGSVREMVLSGRGLAMMPRMLVSESVPWLYLERPEAYREVGVIWRRGAELSLVAQTFLQFLIRATRASRPPRDELTEEHAPRGVPAQALG